MDHRMIWAGIVALKGWVVRWTDQRSASEVLSILLMATPPSQLTLMHECRNFVLESGHQPGSEWKSDSYKLIGMDRYHGPDHPGTSGLPCSIFEWEYRRRYLCRHRNWGYFCENASRSGDGRFFPLSREYDGSPHLGFACLR